MSQFIMEVGTEEIPARFLPGLETNLQELAVQHLQNERISFDSVDIYSTPRRFVLWIANINPFQEQTEEIITGPPVNIAYDGQGALTKAGTGFARSQGVEPDRIFTRKTAKGDYLAIEKKVGGAEVSTILPDVCSAILHNLSFPKKMRWETTGFTFARPIRWLMALLDNAVIPFQVASIVSDRYTWGHRVMGPGPWQIPSAKDYFSIISEQGQVVLDVGNRKEFIRSEGERLAKHQGGSVVWSSSLFQEVANLVEFPKPVLGGFDQAYLELPREVLLTSMESHQKSFGLEDDQGRLLPFFLCTLNLEPKDLQLVKSGWERVLKARLEDAAFFYQADLKTPMDKWVQELDKVVFLGPLGSMGNKSRRLQRLSCQISKQLDPALESDISRAALLAKADLVSEMVGEFADLQGKMGGIYAREKGESEIVASAVYEHYLPVGPESEVPESLAGSILSIADKLDNLCGCFGLNLMPSGAHDPYALRRQTLGVIRIVLEHGLRLSLGQLMQNAVENYEGTKEFKLSSKEILSALLKFFSQRLEVYFSSQGFDTLVVDAVLMAGFDDMWAAAKRLEALQRFSREKDFEHAVLAFKRADNLLRKQVENIQDVLDGQYKWDLLHEPGEKDLASCIEAIAPKWDTLWQEEEFDQLFGLLRELRPYVDEFFNQVMVMTKDQDLRKNRLNLLKAMVGRLSILADFSALQI